ncbi:polysaccharide lyase family 8 protein [Fistulina hepatica ATCC 64428]|uniref:Polysaccharide lyase family 8 protein n=1 Tax=Fistulina hepatica ATCC 64428 TaxID=1128425 RepID=A0A0D7AMM2_9AGAR|nr:polysaccharide lyase family 8 protein [Fistulina hepatica ATCC 64428]
MLAIHFCVLLVFSSFVSLTHAIQHISLLHPHKLQRELKRVRSKNHFYARDVPDSSAPARHSSTDIQTIQARRVSTIIGGLDRAAQVSGWLSSLSERGSWPDVDYTTGCDARRANWPAEEHWSRIATMAGAWHGGFNGSSPQYVKNASLLARIILAMDFWFKNDFTNIACLDSGSTSSCPCGTPGLWNTNWYSNILGLPLLVSKSCLLIGTALPAYELGHCTTINLRAYGTFDHDIHGVGYLTGANTLDLARVGIDQAVLTVNTTLLSDAYRRIHNELKIQNFLKADGIRADGSFGQHAGILYNGNYGKDYTNDVLDLETASAGTSYTADAAPRSAFETLFDGHKWMIVHNVLTHALHWDFSVLGRFISFPVADNQATASINLNLTEIDELGTAWSSDSLRNFASSLSTPSGNANAGSLIGNKMFYANDYMVHRGANYVTTLKMYSSRTQNTECTNSQNPLGFHLSDGTTYTYLQGNEYEDIAAAWDWNLIPGTTVDYGATPLSCGTARYTGVESFVGGVSSGEVGISVMRYTNPSTGNFTFQKAWFFLKDDAQRVMVSNITSETGAPVYSVLDQRLSAGTFYIDQSPVSSGSYSGTTPHSLFHGGVGYIFPTDYQTTIPVSLIAQSQTRSGDWSTIGISSQPVITVDIFAARLQHVNLSHPIEYTVFPGIDISGLEAKASATISSVETVRNDDHISAVYDNKHEMAMAVFWDSTGGSVDFSAFSLTANGNAAVVYQMNNSTAWVADPSQTLSSVTLTFSFSGTRKHTKSVFIDLAGGGFAGSSVQSPI